MVTCQRCDQRLPGEAQHADAVECFRYMQTTLGSLKLVLAVARQKMENCVKANHAPNRPVKFQDRAACRDCLAISYAVADVSITLVLDGRMP